MDETLEDIRGYREWKRKVFIGTAVALLILNGIFIIIRCLEG
jgi:hypothetical protein